MNKVQEKISYLPPTQQVALWVILRIPNADEDGFRFFSHEFADKFKKFTSEMKEIKVGAASVTMFEVPKDYKKVASMNEVMGGDLQEMMKQMQKSRPQKSPKGE